MLHWSELDKKAVDTARVLAADAVEKVGNGHPGTAISVAPLAYMLYQKVMKIDPQDDRWLGRDKFILSIGHSSLTQYTQMFLAGLGLELDDLKSLRTWGALTPGHPEYGHTQFVETTTGPLGAGVANAVGMAMAARRIHGMFDPNTPVGESLFDHNVYVILGDGCMQEGVAAEAVSLAGTQKLGNLIMFYDDNHISIEGDTKIAFNEDINKRFEAYGWHTQTVDWTNGGTGYAEDIDAIYEAVLNAQKVTDKPSLIRVRTLMAWPCPTMQGKHNLHGNKLGAEELAGLKEAVGFDPDKSFDVDEAVLSYCRKNVAERGASFRKEWEEKFATWKQENPKEFALYERLVAGELPESLNDALPVFDGEKMSTRKASGEVLSALADVMPELWGGSADLAGSNCTTMKGQPSFIPEELSSDDFQGHQFGRTLHFGIREHAMGGVMNGMALTGLTRPYGGTFLVFSDYMRPAVRLAALMGIPSVFVWSHDSIGVGEDGPTHQPIEHLASLRAIPNLDVVRPADANETSVVWGEILRHQTHPSALILSRQDLPILDRSSLAGAENAIYGGYVLADSDRKADVILVATGSEIALALKSKESLESEGIATRVVSMPCIEWFKAQSQEYRDSVLPTDIPKVSVEAGISMGWKDLLGAESGHVSIEHFGASAAANVLFEKFGFTAENVVKIVKDTIE
ncbi:transketolase [Actinomyces sp. zg-332]|uniref:transketolase n=1 Tax=Actinomyces sp. zg-332 TaxID=2708340 RepID=UPI00141E59B7|nr:transketolase [Actinomyces sp. zg-332]QPK94182.1 transketolase [Actinomyces sp. zg-332]